MVIGPLIMMYGIRWRFVRVTQKSLIDALTSSWNHHSGTYLGCDCKPTNLWSTGYKPQLLLAYNMDKGHLTTNYNIER